MRAFGTALALFLLVLMAARSADAGGGFRDLVKKLGHRDPDVRERAVADLSDVPGRRGLLLAIEALGLRQLAESTGGIHVKR